MATIKQNIPQLLEYADALIIKTDDDIKTAINMLSNIKENAKQAESVRRFFVDPYNALVTKINAYFKPLTLSLTDADRKVRQKMMAYQQEITAKAEKARLATMKKIEDGKITIEQGVKKLENVIEPEKTVRSTEATMTFRIQKKVEIVNPNLLPREYLIPDEVKIRRVAIAGVAIPGVKVIEEKVPALRNNF